MKTNIYEDIYNRHILEDGTFKVYPFGDYKQLLIVYIQHMEKL